MKFDKKDLFENMVTIFKSINADNLTQIITENYLDSHIEALITKYMDIYFSIFLKNIESFGASNFINILIKNIPKNSSCDLYSTLSFENLLSLVSASQEYQKLCSMSHMKSSLEEVIKNFKETYIKNSLKKFLEKSMNDMSCILDFVEQKIENNIEQDITTLFNGSYVIESKEYITQEAIHLFFLKFFAQKANKYLKESVAKLISEYKVKEKCSSVLPLDSQISINGQKLFDDTIKIYLQSYNLKNPNQEEKYLSSTILLDVLMSIASVECSSKEHFKTKNRSLSSLPSEILETNDQITTQTTKRLSKKRKIVISETIDPNNKSYKAKVTKKSPTCSHR